MKTTRPMLHSCVPAALREAVQVLAKSSGMTVSALIREVLVRECALSMSKWQDSLTSDPKDCQIDSVKSIAILRKGITACSTPGRLQNMGKRAAYARYCRACRHLKALPEPFDMWTSHNIVLPPRSKRIGPTA